MGQAEVYQFLKQNEGRAYSAKEISEQTDCARNSVQTSLRRIKLDEIRIREGKMNKKGKPVKLYTYKPVHNQTERGKK